MYSLVISELVPGDNNVIEHLACTTCYDISDDPLCIYTSSSFKSSKRTPMNVCSVSWRHRLASLVVAVCCTFVFVLHTYCRAAAGDAVSLGTGKTTTLLEYARLRPHLKFLLVVYNRWVTDSWSCNYTVSQKKVLTFKLSVTLSNLNGFSIFFCTAGKRMKFSTKPVWQYRPHFRHVLLHYFEKLKLQIFCRSGRKCKQIAF